MIAFDEILMRDNTINGALLVSRERNAVFVERGRLRGPATGTRLPRTA
jgi:hypothetical protein